MTIIPIILDELGPAHPARAMTVTSGSLLDDMRVDSMDRICIAVRLDEKFSIELADAEIEASVAARVGGVVRG